MAAKRKSLKEKLAGYQADEDGRAELADLMKQLVQIKQDAVGWRGYYAIATIQSQDRILSLYREFIQAIQPSLAGSSDDVLDLECFPNDYDLLHERVKLFLLMVIAQATPRSRQDQHITYSTAANYRSTIIYWAMYKYRLRGIDILPRKAKLYMEMTEVMRLSAKINDLKKATTRRGDIGLVELQYLIDMDIRGTPRMEIAESHHLAWCIGRVTAVRPGSLGVTDGRRMDERDTEKQPYLAWKDIRIHRGCKRGEFIVFIDIRNLKTNTVDHEREYLSKGPGGSYGNRVLTFRIGSPQRAATLWMSVPHRILIIALRRQILVGIETLDELFDGDKALIHIKDEYLNSPVLIASTSGDQPSGSPRDDGPISSKMLTNYLGERGIRAGFPVRPTFYSIRRRCAADMTRFFGADRARELMGHDPGSLTLECYYLEFGYMTNSAAALAGDDPDDTQQRIDMQREKREQFRFRLDREHLANTQGRALNALVAQLLTEDTAYAALTNVDEIRRYQRRTRALALDTLYRETHAKFQANMTRLQLQSRDEEADRALSEAADFARTIQHKTLERIRQMDTDWSGLDVDELKATHNLDVEFLEPEAGAAQGELEADADDFTEEELKLATIRRDAIIEENGDDAANRHQLTTLEYSDLAYTFMQLLLENAFSEREAGIDGKRVGTRYVCTLCLDDDTLGSDYKTKLYKSGDLKRHQGSQIHHMYRTIIRRIRCTANENGWLFCPYCLEIVEGEPSLSRADCAQASMLKTILYHIRDFGTSGTRKVPLGRLQFSQDWPEELIVKHEQLKTAGGWYEADFYGDQNEIGRRLAVERVRQADIEWSADEPLYSGLVDQQRPGVRLGGPMSEDIPDAFQGKLQYCAPGHVQPDTPYNFGFEGEPAEALSLPTPPNFQSVVIAKGH